LDTERACEAIVAAQKDFSRALAACRSREARLRAIAKAGASNAAALRHGEQIGLRLSEYETLNRDWKAPWELTWRAPRPGPTRSWQAFDRALQTLSAVLDEPTEPLEPRARAWDALAQSATELAAAIAAAGPQDRAVCSFCAKPANQVHKMIAGSRPGLYICSECIATCVEVLDQD